MLVSGISSSSFSQSFDPAAAQIRSKQIQQLGQDLQSGNLSRAQSDFSVFKQDLQREVAVSTHRLHRQRGAPIFETSRNGQDNPGTRFGLLGRQLQSGNLAAAQQTYSALQEDFLQFIGGNASSLPTAASAPITASPGLNVSA